MSIINEALKKTEESIQRNSLKEISEPDKKVKLKPYLFYILIFVVGLLLSNIIFTIINRKIESPHVPEPPKVPPISDRESQVSQTPPAVMPTPLLEKQEQAKKNFILSGIFFSDHDGYALVNNQIIRENDLVDRAKVEKITVNTVELNSEGETIILSTSR
ncbi:MAG: hypothetical protein KJ710_04175 [Candidatus Omnitrophica bacterium]|nr:hypothetical protein [Candidatus Omnitrophota bacterium]MBU1923439.1 hypothetical protein [Candidatus Omnitrophota bacterium]